MYLTFRVKADHAEKVIRKHIDKLFHKDRETRRKDKWRNTRNFFFDSGTKNKKGCGRKWLSERWRRMEVKREDTREIIRFIGRRVGKRKDN